MMARCDHCGCFVGRKQGRKGIRFEPRVNGKPVEFIGIAYGKTRLASETCPLSINGETWGPGPRVSES